MKRLGGWLWQGFSAVVLTVVQSIPDEPVGQTEIVIPLKSGLVEPEPTEEYEIYFMQTVALDQITNISSDYNLHFRTQYKGLGPWSLYAAHKGYPLYIEFIITQILPTMVLIEYASALGQDQAFWETSTNLLVASEASLLSYFRNKPTLVVPDCLYYD
jgi:hypothetical protein